MAIDTVGAGHMFYGYLAASLDRGDDVAQGLRRAAIAGLLDCLKDGAQTAIPSAQEVEANIVLKRDVVCEL
ncbi:hypothetical protein NIBR502774_14435 (plasmid) [Rhizobium sp. NIBRBAC000502774]|nr:hypothetical protein NIBR502774_14435 [Rhizobium sp. NIBRBAC000502774]